MTKKKQLEQALKGLAQYIKQKDADLSLISTYLRQLADWVDAPQADSSDPSNPPPPPPGHK